MERGRPRIFDEEHALDAALGIFWRNGYQGTSLADLTNAMGISKPSMYAAFGNKENLYLRALERYRQKHLKKHAETLAAEPDLKKAMRGFLRSVASMLAAPDLPGGCMVVNCAVAFNTPALPADIVDAIGQTVDQSSISLIKQRLQEELKRRKIPKSTSIEQLADYYATLMSGMAIMAKVGVSEDRLFDIIEHSLHALPISGK